MPSKVDEAILRRLYQPLADWFRGRFPGLSEIQRLALPHTLDGENTLILAPTGSGKTLSAFLSALSDLGARAAENRLPNAAHTIYISPLRSLGRDIHRNLEEPLAALNHALPEKRRIRMEVRTGDTEYADRGRMSRQRPHLLVTTPESLTALLSQAGWKEGFAPATVIIDEIHSFAEGKRGSLLALTLERLEMRANGPLQRIGLSATAHPIEAVRSLLCGERPCQIAESEMKKSYSLSIALPTDRILPAAGWNPYRIAHVVADLTQNARCSLIFTATRSGAERLGLALKVLLPEWDEQIAVHHGSVDRDERNRIEADLAAGLLRAVVCSSSLELGVDFAAVDQVVMVGAPHGVSRTLQRMGRSGHRLAGAAQGVLAPLNLQDLMECIALQKAAEKRRLDRLRIPRAPLDVLAQALLGMSIERVWSLDEAFDTVRRSGPYRNLTRDQFDMVIDYLQGGGRVLGPYGTYGKIVVKDGQFEVASRKTARQYYMNIGVISDDFQIKVVTQKHRSLGSVEEGFLASLRPTEAFLIGGQAWVLERLHQNTAVVRKAGGERVQTSRWGGQKFPLTAELARQELELRRSLRDAYGRGGFDAVRRVLVREYEASEETADQAIYYLIRQLRAAPIPVDSPVQVELLSEGRTRTMLFHVLAGRAVNRSLAWVVGRRLGGSGSVAANFDDHSFLLSFGAKMAPTIEALREAFHPAGFQEDLQRELESTEALGRGFRAVAEIGQLLPRRTPHGRVGAKAASWSGSLLYSTLLKYEPEHPLVQEAVREAVEDQMDGERAEEESRRIYESPWETFALPRPSPFALPLYASYHRETLSAQDPDKALDELVESLFEEWQEEHEPAGGTGAR